MFSHVNMYEFFVFSASKPFVTDMYWKYFLPEKSLVYSLILFSGTSLLQRFVNLSFGGVVHLYFKESSLSWGHKYILQYFPAEDLRFYFYI